MSRRDIALSTIWQLLSQILTAALSMVTVKLVAIGLAKPLAGLYNSAYGSLQLFGILADFGLYAVAVREVSKAANRDRALGALILLRGTILVLSLTAALVLAWTIPAWRGTALPTAITIAALVPFFTLLAGMLRATFQVHFRMELVFVAEVAQRILTTALIALIVWNGARGSTDERDLYAFLFVGGIGAFLLLLLSCGFARRTLKAAPMFDGALALQFLKAAAPYGFAYLAIACYRQLDIALIALLRSDFEVQNASYGFVVRITDMAFVIPTFLLNSVLPILNDPATSRDRQASLAGSTLLALIGICGTGGIVSFLWARPLLALLTTPAYLSSAGHPGADTALTLLALPIVLNSVILYAFYALLTRHAWRPLVAVLGGGALLSVGLNLWLIPSMGFLGAATTSVLVHILLALALLPLSLRYLPLRLDGRQVRAWAGMLCSAALLAAALRPMLIDDFRTLAAGALLVGGLALSARILGLLKGRSL